MYLHFENKSKKSDGKRSSYHPYMKSTALSAALWSDLESESGRYQLATKVIPITPF